MANESKLPAISLTTVTVAVGALAWWLLPTTSNNHQSSAPPSAAEMVVTTPLLETSPTPVPKAGRGVAKRRAMPPVGTPQSLIPENPGVPLGAAGASFRAEDYSKSRMQIYFEFQRAVRTWTPEIFDQKSQLRETLTGEQLYEVYVYLRSCLDSLRSVDGFQKRARAMEQHQRRNPENFPLEQLQNSLERYRTDLARCEGIGEDLAGGLEPVLVDWLTLAAERGYPQAQLAYHQSIRWLLTRQQMTVYRDPLAVHQYRERAPLYLRAAIRSGHSEAFVEYSLAMQEGILFEQDDELAFAYARAADLAAHGNNDMARVYLAILENVLQPGQIASARKRGRELCDQWCL